MISQSYSENPAIHDENVKKLKVEFSTSTRPISNSETEDTIENTIKTFLRTTHIKTKYKKKLTCWIDEFEKFLDSLPIHNDINISEFARKVSNRPSRDLRFVQNIVNHCRNNLRCDEDIPIGFLRPESVGTFGLYKIDALPGPNIEINLHITMPKGCFKTGDFQNNRYFVKKFFFLMYIAEHLYPQNICSSIKCTYYCENILLPYLKVCPNGTEKMSVRLFLIPEQNFIDDSRLSPDINNIDKEIFETDVGSINDINEWPTTLYNAALAFDASLAENNAYAEQVLSSCVEFREGLKLIVIWMKKRKLDTGLGGFTTDLANYLLLFMISRGMIHENMSTIKIFKTFIYFLYNFDLTLVPLSINDEISEEVLQIFKKSFDIVLLDKTGRFNTASFLNVGAYLKMKSECKLAIDYLNGCDSHSVLDLFSVEIPLYLQYDAVIDVKNENNYEFLLETVTPSEKVKYLGYHMLLVIKILQQFLSSCFHGWAKSIVPIMPLNSEWNYGLRHKISNNRVLFGIQFEKDATVLQYTPIYNKIRNVTKDRRDIIKMIVDELLAKKLNLNYKLYYNELEDFLLNQNVETWYPSGTNEETTQKIIIASEDLASKIKYLNIHPEITAIRPISDVFCYTDVFPTIPSLYEEEKLVKAVTHKNILFKDKTLNKSPRYVKTVESVIEFDVSIGLPNYSLKLLQQRETSLLERISSLLKEQYSIISSVEYPIIDVLYGGIVFRYNIHFSNKIYLTKICLQSSDEKVLEEYDVCNQMEKKLVITPKIVQVLKCINTKYPSYGLSTCLAKRWIRAQLIDDFLLPDMAINLLNSYQYLNETFYNVAIVPQVAFLRFLKFLVEFQWDSQPVVLNFRNELSDELINKVRNEFIFKRRKYPDLYILSPYDYRSVFTELAPCKEVLSRLKILAAEFLNFAEKIVLDESLYSWKELFIPNKRGYDCILNIKPSFVPRKHHQITSSARNSKIIYLEPNKDNCIPIVNFDPVELYLKDLRSTYGKFCVFFHDTFGGNFIGVLWRPDYAESKSEMKKGFEILGKDILQSIDMNNS